MEEKMTLEKWYGSSVRIPQYWQHQYVGFVASCLGLVRSIIRRKKDLSVCVRFSAVETAAADQENGLILINESYLNGEFKLGLPVLERSKTVAVLLGIVVHECGHFAYTPPDAMSASIKHLLTKTPYAKSEDVAKTVANIVEDIYIEAELDRDVPSLSWTVQEANNLFFHDKFAQRVEGEALSIEGAPQHLSGVAAVLNLLVLAKTREDVITTAFTEPLFAEVKRAKNLPRFEDRLALSLSLYNQVMCEVKEEECKGGHGKKALLEVEKTSKGLTAKGATLREKASVLANPINNTISKLDEGEVDFADSEMAESYGFTPTPLVVEYALSSGKEVEVDERYAALAEVARQRAVVNHPYGLDKKRGRDIRKLYRIATDGKIFAEQVSMNAYKPMQVAILVDCSGSMEGNRILDAIRAATGAALALAEAHCDVAVYGHTADQDGILSTTIYKAKGFREPLAGLESRMGAMLSSDLIENRDGYAIEYVGKKFTDKRKRRVLIVLSDGAPMANGGYTGTGAFKHTKDAIQRVRQLGVDVLSISITPTANYTNSGMYGEQWNVYNEDPNVIGKIVSTLLGA